MIRLISPSRQPDELRLCAMLDVGRRVEMLWEHAHAGVEPDGNGGYQQQLPKGIALGMEYMAGPHDRRWVAVLWDDSPEPEWIDASWLKVMPVDKPAKETL